MHAATPAELPHLTRGARLLLLGPGAVPVRLEAVIPYFHKVVFVDIALVIIGPDAGACRYSPVGKDSAHADARAADEKAVPDVTFIVSQKALAAVGGLDAAFAPRVPDKIHKPAELFAGEL